LKIIAKYSKGYFTINYVSKVFQLGCGHQSQSFAHQMSESMFEKVWQ